MADHAVSCVLKLYSTLNFCPPDGQFTVLAAFILSHEDEHKVISLATGTKCLPDIKLPRTGDALHDSHAEVLARRGAVRWFLEEAIRLYKGTESKWIVRSGGGVFQLKDEVVVRFYVSTLPCECATISPFGYLSGARRGCFHSVPGADARRGDGHFERLI